MVGVRGERVGPGLVAPLGADQRVGLGGLGDVGGEVGQQVLGVAGEHVGRVLGCPVQHQLLALPDHLSAEIGGQRVDGVGDDPGLVGIDDTGP